MAMMRFQHPSAAEVDGALARVYARPEFAEIGGATWLQTVAETIAAIREAILGYIADVLERVGAVTGSEPGVWLIAGASLLLVGWMLFRLARARRTRQRRRDRIAVAPLESARDAAEWDAEADRAIAEGRFRDAAFALYHALVLRLEVRGALRFGATKTPGDYRREVAHHTDASRALNGFLRLFEPLAWGRHGVDAETLERLRAAAAQAATHG